MELEEAERRVEVAAASCEHAYDAYVPWAQQWMVVETQLSNAIGHEDRMLALNRQSDIRFKFIAARDSYEDAVRRLENAQTDLDEVRSSDPLYALLYGVD